MLLVRFRKDVAVSDGFTELYLRGHLELSVEFLALKPEFRDLFLRELQAEARRRLEDVNYPAPPEIR